MPRKPATRRIAINAGGGYVPGLSTVVTGVVMAASELGWEVLGIHDGFDGLLFPERYPGGGVIDLSHDATALGAAARTDPFHVRTVNGDNIIEEADRSDQLLRVIRAHSIDAVVSVAGPKALGVLFKLYRKGLKTVCVPESVENDVAATHLSFGFNSALSFAAETLERVRDAAQSTRRIGVVELLGEHAGWLALQAGMTVCADVVLIPEIPYDVHKIAARLGEKMKNGRRHGLVVVAEGATPRDGRPPADSLAADSLAADSLAADSLAMDPLGASLTPNATEPDSAHTIGRSGRAAESIALQLQRLTDQQVYSLVLGQLVKGGAPTAVDRQLGLGYGAGAVCALKRGQSGVMVTFQPPDLKFVPLEKAINRFRTIPVDSVFVETARALGISLGD